MGDGNNSIARTVSEAISSGIKEQLDDKNEALGELAVVTGKYEALLKSLTYNPSTLEYVAREEVIKLNRELDSFEQDFSETHKQRV